MNERRRKSPCACSLGCAQSPDGRERQRSHASSSEPSSDQAPNDSHNQRETMGPQGRRASQATGQQATKILSRTVGEALRYDPSPLDPPEVDPDLTNMPAIERSGEVFRFQTLNIEHSLSPGGTLREWLKVVVRIAIILAVPTILLVPVITFLLSGLSEWSTFLARVAVNLTVVLPAILLLYLFIKVCGWLLGRRR